jgi:hypothetical protein
MKNSYDIDHAEVIRCNMRDISEVWKNSGFMENEYRMTK